jgi:hypothetical protein
LNDKPTSKSEKLTITPTPTPVVCLEKNYQLKSKASLAAMTPRQLIDELVKFNPDTFDPYFEDINSEELNYEWLVGKYVRKTGTKALPVLTEYMNAFEPQSASYCEGLRFSIARRLAHDLDRFEFRLRGTKEGQLAIDAFERAIERGEKPGVKEKSLKEDRTIFLRELKGVNEVDQAIRETFLMRKSIEMSESELLKFSNFLTERDPTYPSWSERDFVKDYSRINKAGNPLQVYILKKPERFYEAYLAFKDTKR